MSRAQIWIVGVLILGGTLSVRAQTTQWETGTYAYDGAGNIKSIGTTEQYRYDASGRLTSGTIATGQTQTVTYDPYGNIKTITTAGSALAVGVDPATNRATQTHEAQTNTAYNVYATYDLAGRLTSALNGAGGTYSYDALDSVMKSTGNGVTKVHWYTASDERIASVAVVNNNGTWSETESEWTLRDPSGKVLRRLQKTGTQWTWKQDYIYAGSQLLAAETDTPARTLHFFPDHLGTARLITANGGTKVAFHTYYPFGDEATASSQDSEKLKFTGHERDAANLDYMHARYYAPKWGRFLSVDPVLNLKRALPEPQNWNRYAYVMNNPLKYTDPTGKDVSIRLSFKGDGWTDEEKKKIIGQVTSWYQKQNVGKVFVFDGAKASHGGNFLSRMFSGGYTSINVSSGTGTKHTPTTVFAGNYSGLSAAQRINAISNSIIHETVAHHFGATAGNNADQMFFARDSGYRMWDSVRQRYGTVADSYSYADPATRGNVTNGPIPIHPEDAKKLQRELKDENVEPPDYDP